MIIVIAHKMLRGSVHCVCTKYAIQKGLKANQAGKNSFDTKAPKQGAGPFFELSKRVTQYTYIGR